MGRSSMSAILVVLLVASVVPAYANVLYVPSQYPTIQSAVNAAAAGDSIQIAAGTYNERVVIGRGGISLVATGAASTLITAEYVPAIVES